MVRILTAAAALLLLAGCTTGPESLGAIQQAAIAQCEATSPGAGFKGCYDSYVEERRQALVPKTISPEDARADFFLDRERVPFHRP